MPVPSLEWKIWVYFPDQSQLGHQSWPFGLSPEPPVFAWAVLQVCSALLPIGSDLQTGPQFWVELEADSYLAMLCLMIIKVRPELASHGSSPAWGPCGAAPQQWRCFLAHILGYQLVFPHGAALVTDWQCEHTLGLKALVNSILNISVFSISFSISYHLSWKQDNLLLDFIGLNWTIIFIGLHFYSWHTCSCPSLCSLHPSGKLCFSIYAHVIFLC